MEIINEQHAQAMIAEWRKLQVPARKREILLAIQKLELNAMYYEQKGLGQAVTRTENCIAILRKYLDTLQNKSA